MLNQHQRTKKQRDILHEYKPYGCMQTEWLTASTWLDIANNFRRLGAFFAQNAARVRFTFHAYALRGIWRCETRKKTYKRKLARSVHRAIRSACRGFHTQICELFWQRTKAMEIVYILHTKWACDVECVMYIYSCGFSGSTCVFHWICVSISTEILFVEVRAGLTDGGQSF